MSATPERQEDAVATFLAGMDYAGKMPSIVEITAIARHLHTSHLVAGTRRQIEERVTNAMTAMHAKAKKKFEKMHGESERET